MRLLNPFLRRFGYTGDGPRDSAMKLRSSPRAQANRAVPLFEGLHGNLNQPAGLNMTEEVSIEIVVDPSLYDHCQENLSRLNAATAPAEEITRLVQIILDGSEFPLEAHVSGERQVRISYHLRSFSQPFYWS
ncbi:MAG: hypothetical protein KDI63_07600 [Gammaproteobacteria bacterium]|nr:hypothetical protein [Gammaproteobacteria bacterium]